MNILELLAIPQYGVPDKVALSYRNNSDSQSLTYAELHGQIEEVANGLVAWGLKPGDRVAFFLSNRPEFVIGYLAVLKAGGVATPINLRYRRKEIGHILGDSRPRLLITEDSLLDILQNAEVNDSSVEAIILAEQLDGWRSSDPSVRLPAVAERDLASIIYTSGTTGTSKGAMLNHSNIVATVTALMTAWAWERDDRLLLCLPLYHVHGLFVGLLAGLATGAEVMLRQKYDGDTVIDDLLHADPTLFFAVPTIYVRLVNALAKTDSPGFSHMRLFCSGSAALSPEIHEQFRRLTGHTILERYGMTETGMNLSNPYAGERRAGTVGKPLPGVEMCIVDNEHRTITAGQEGELLVRGSNVFSGYWEAPEKTASSFVTDESGQVWFCTGDLARQDPVDGYVTLLGRRHELIISGGFNIYPREIEELLESYPGVLEAAVVGQPHHEWGEVPVAFLACNPDVEDVALDAYCRDNLASFKAPVAFHRVDELPRNTMGKLQKHLLPDSPL